MVESAVVIGTGLIGTSIALALRQRGVDVALSDRDSAALELACELGAGTPLVEDLPEPADIAVVAVPPSAVPAALRDAQQRGLARVYTDVASVKTSVVRQAAELGCTMASYVPGHPMGAGEAGAQCGPRRPVPRPLVGAVSHPQTDPVAVKPATLLAELCGANPWWSTRQPTTGRWRWSPTPPTRCLPRWLPPCSTGTTPRLPWPGKACVT